MAFSRLIGFDGILHDNELPLTFVKLQFSRIIVQLAFIYTFTPLKNSKWLQLI